MNKSRQLLDLLVHKVNKGQWDLLVHKVNKGQWDLRDLKVITVNVV